MHAVIVRVLLAIVAAAALAAPALVSSALVSPVLAQAKEQIKDLRVVTRVLPPMVSERDGTLTGFSIELWNEIAKRLDRKSSYRVAPDIAALLNDVRSGNAALGVAAISITSAREAEFEFSQALDNKTVDAVVFDSPVLLYYAANDGKGRVTTVGAPFRKEDYGIVFPRGSPLRSQVNVVLLKMLEDGTYRRIYDKWFAGK